MRVAPLLRPALLVIVALAMGACSDSSATEGTQTSSSTTATVPVNRPSASPSSTSGGGRPTESEVKAAYINFRNVTDGVFRRGGTNAEADLRRVAIEPQLQVLVDRAASYQQRGIHVVRPAEAKSISVTSLSARSGSKAAQALLQVCVDSSHSRAVDKNGNTVRRDSPLHFFIETVNMVQFTPGQWLVVDETDKQVNSC